jgi:short-subunit dehydrogenase
MDLRDKHVVVTGASAGIGRGIALELARAGARLTLVARRAEALAALAEDIRREGLADATVIAADLMVDDDWLARARLAGGPIDVLVNNAGVQIIGPTHAVDLDAGERLLHINLVVPLRLIRRVLPEMRERGGGVVVNIASMAALAPTQSMTYYNASKGGLAAASEALRGELRPAGVDVVTVYPGIIETDMARDGIAAYEKTVALRLQPRGTTEALAQHVRRAIEKRRPRVVYPRFNALARLFPGVTRWTMDHFTPRLAAS